jgi:hypothetical protein
MRLLFRRFCECICDLEPSRDRSRTKAGGCPALQTLARNSGEPLLEVFVEFLQPALTCFFEAATKFGTSREWLMMKSQLARKFLGPCVRIGQSARLLLFSVSDPVNRSPEEISGWGRSLDE